MAQIIQFPNKKTQRSRRILNAIKAKLFELIRIKQSLLRLKEELKDEQNPEFPKDSA